MARGPKYKVPRRRRREGKTNYHKRYRMVMSGKPRLVVRRTLNYIWVQIVEARENGDITLAAAHSRELAKLYGWKAPGDNTPAAYLTGLLAGLRALGKGVKQAVPDIGLHRPVKGARIFAAIKGAIDAGLEVPVSDEVVPGEERIRGEHIASWASTLAEESPEKYEAMFSRYIKAGLRPQDLPSHFEEVRAKILESFNMEVSEK